MSPLTVAQNLARHLLAVLGTKTSGDLPEGGADAWPSQTQLRAMVDQVPDLLFVKDRNSRFQIANAATALDVGHEDPSFLIGKTDYDFYDAAVASKFFEQEAEVINLGKSFINIEQLSGNIDNGEKWLSVTKVPLRDTDGAIVGLIGCCRDITQRKHEDRLREGQAAVLEMIVQNTNLPEIFRTLVDLVEAQCHGVRASILLLDDSGVTLEHGSAPSLPRAYTDAIDGVAIGEGVGSCGTAAFRRAPVSVSDISTDPLWSDYKSLILPYGLQACWSWPILSADGRVLGTSAMYCQDMRHALPKEQHLATFITHLAGMAIQRSIAERRVNFLAHHDTLTLLPNRFLLGQHIQERIHAGEGKASTLIVLLIDLDNFKLINDSLGHKAGDELLRVIAKRLQSFIFPSGFFARFGGDEFVFLFQENEVKPISAAEISRRLRSLISQPVTLHGNVLQVAASVGAACFPADGTNAEELLSNADAALYQAKASGRDTVTFYNAAMKIHAVDQLERREELRLAIQKEQFVLHYQPQLCLKSDTVVGVEALVRWNHPRLGLLSPMEFIPLLEQTGLIVVLGEWVLREACVQNKKWQDEGFPAMTMSVNVSARQFQERDWICRVCKVLDETALQARFLELELTESMLVQDPARTSEKMQELGRLGIGIAIDDFGTGYSSLSSLRTFPITRLKIDKAFVDRLPDHTSDQAIMMAIIALGHALNQRVIAEGVETNAQVRLLEESGCDEAQGFHIGRPMPAYAIETFLRERSTSTRYNH